MINCGSSITDCYQTAVELNEDFFRTAQERIEETEATRICNISDYF